MRSAPGAATTTLHVGADGTLRIPAEIISAAQLLAGDAVAVRIESQQLAVIGGIKEEDGQVPVLDWLHSYAEEL